MMIEKWEKYCQYQKGEKKISGCIAAVAEIQWQGERV